MKGGRREEHHFNQPGFVPQEAFPEKPKQLTTPPLRKPQRILNALLCLSV